MHIDIKIIIISMNNSSINMVRYPSRYDILFISEYALKMINEMPENAKEIKLSGDVLYAYLSSQGQTLTAESPTINYETYTEFNDNLAKLILLTDNEISDEERKIKHDCLQFNQFYDDFWYVNKTIHLSGFITIDLSKFAELEHFSVYQIYCKTIIHIPDTLKLLHCRSCIISKLNKMPKKLEMLNCSGNRLRIIPQLYHTSLKSLFCNANLLNKLPVLPNSVEWIYCYDNKISQLPSPLPTSLEILSCSNNDLTFIPQIPNNLVGLYIDNNYISNIPFLPKTLVDLFFANNKIVKMPELPPFLKRITCYMNPIREYTPLPPSVKYANIDGTLMEL